MQLMSTGVIHYIINKKKLTEDVYTFKVVKQFK